MKHLKERSVDFWLAWLLITLLSLAVVLSLSTEAAAQTKVYFKVSSSVPDTISPSNRAALRQVDSLASLAARYPNSTVVISSSSSPEGPRALNERLSRSRAEAILSRTHLDTLPSHRLVVEAAGPNWAGLVAMMQDDASVSSADAVDILNSTIDGKISDPECWRRLSRLDKGQMMTQIRRKYLPALRYAEVALQLPPVHIECCDRPHVVPEIQFGDLTLEPALLSSPAMPEPATATGRSWVVALKSNLLADILLLPNLGVEFAPSRNVTVAIDWTYAWWSRNARHRYWRAYGGDVVGRWWPERSYRGHHFGAYAQVYTYDFEFGGKGYMGGNPGHDIFHHPSWGAGIEYGYSLPIARRLNLDFTIGLGYFGGRYHRYIPDGGCYVWQETHRMHWVGPTKAEVSLVWLIGPGANLK